MAISVAGDFVVIGLNRATPKYFWQGKDLTDVTGMIAHVSDGADHIRLTVRDGTAFDSDYLEMSEAGISIKKERN